MYKVMPTNGISKFKAEFKELSLTERSLTHKNTMKTVCDNVKPFTYVLFCCFRQASTEKFSNQCVSENTSVYVFCLGPCGNEADIP